MIVAGLLDAMRSDMPPAHRIVWQCLESHADCARLWASSGEAVAAELNMSLATVTRAICALKEAGIIQTINRSRRSTVFHLQRKYSENAMQIELQNASPSIDPTRILSAAPSAVPGTLPSSSLLGTAVEPRESTKEQRALGTRDAPSMFDEFYAAYPRKTSRRAAEKAYSGALKRGATHADLMQGLSRYRFSDDPQFRPHPATWLNQDRWLDEPDPTGGIRPLDPNNLSGMAYASYQAHRELAEYDARMAAQGGGDLPAIEHGD